MSERNSGFSKIQTKFNELTPYSKDKDKEYLNAI